MTKGWHNQPGRHALSSYGIKTTQQHTARAVGSPNLIGRYSGNDARRIVDDILLRDGEIRSKLPPYHDIEVIKFWKDGSMEFYTVDEIYSINIDKKIFDEILKKVGELDL